MPCYADGLLVGRIVSPHWLTNFAARISWCPVADRSSVVEALEPAPYDGPRVEPTNGAAETLPMGGITRMDAKGNKWLRLAICPFTDDCIVRQGNSTSTGTVAFAYPGWRYRDKASRHAVRYVGVPPAGSCSDDNLRLIPDEFREGTTVGWIAEGPDGAKVSIFVDVSFFVGDYVQVAKSSHMRGVCADAPCPLCAYRKQKEAGSQYAGVGDCTDASLARTTARTLSVLLALSALDKED